MLNKFSFFILFLLLTTCCYGQRVQVEGAATIQKVKTNEQYFNDHTIWYPSFRISYLLSVHHQIGLTFGAISGQTSFHLPPNVDVYYPPGTPILTRLHVRAYPIGLQYRYQFLKSAPVHPYAAASFLLIPITDEKDYDTPSHKKYHSISWGGNFSIGLDVKLIKRFGIFGAINYRLVKNSDRRPSQNIVIEGFWTQFGTKIYL
jgi:hypothetical protein